MTAYRATSPGDDGSVLDIGVNLTPAWPYRFQALSG